MAGVASAAIIEGSLIIGLDDGSIINCGVVQGPQGLKGDPGPMGATGDRGTDGNTIHTVAGTPRNDMGTDGDYAIDNANWRIYGPKSGGVWGKAKEMLPGPENVLENGRFTAATGGGGGGAGTSEGSTIIIGTDPPNLGDAITGLKPGQLWFDSDQLALYILVNDSANQRVWVIVTPADRSAIQDVVTNFTFPDYRTADGTVVHNDVTDLDYVYNATKNQWIDLPKNTGNFEPFVSAYRVVHPDDWDENERGTCYGKTLAYDIDTADNYRSPSFIEFSFNSYDLNGLKFAPQNIHVVAFDYTLHSDKDDLDNNYNRSLYSTFEVTKQINFAGFEGQIINDSFRNLKEGDIIYVRTPSADPKFGPYVQKAGDTMTGALELDDAQRLYLNNTKVETRVRKESLKDGSGDPILDNNGDEQWDDNEDRFVTIESLPPHLLKSDGSFGADTSEPFGINIEIDDGNTHKHRFKVTNRNGDIVTVAGGTGPQVTLGKDFPGNQDPQTGDPHWESGEAGGIKVTGIPTPTKENPELSLAVNKRYVDVRDDELRQDIIELEEEIDALAPAFERGTWRFNPTGSASVGMYGLWALGTSTNEYPQADALFINSVDNTGGIHNFTDVEAGSYVEIFSPDDGDYGLYQIDVVHDETQGSNSFWHFEISHIRSNRPVADAEGVCRVKFFDIADGADPETFVLRRGDTMTGALAIDLSEGGPAEGGNQGKEAKLTLKGDRTGNTDAVVSIKFENASSTQDGYFTFRSKETNAKADAYFKFNQNLQINSKLHVNKIDVYSGNNLDILNYSRFADGFVVKKPNEPIDGDNIFGAKPEYVRTYEVIDENSDENTVVNKKYVDEQIANVGGGGVSGGCIELNGGSLCATPPMPEFIDLIKDNKVAIYLTGCWTGVYSSTQYCYGPVDLKRKVRYVAVNGSNSGQGNGDIIEMPFSAGNDWSKGTKTNISMTYHMDRMSFSPNGKYFGHVRWNESSSSQSYWWMNYTVDISRNSDRETVISETQVHTTTSRAACLGQLCWWDDEHFIFTGYGFAQSSSQKYICEIVYGTITTNNDGSMSVSTRSYDPGNVTGNTDASSSNHQQYIFQANGTIYLRSLNDIYKLTSFEKKSSDWVKVGTFSSRLEGLYYYKELKRYWYSYNGHGYLSRQTEEELNVNTFDNAIRFTFEDHVFSDGTSYNHSPKVTASYPPFMYGTHLIVPTGYHGTKSINGVSEKPYHGFYVYKGGETTGDLFKGDPLNQMSNGYDFNANQSPSAYTYWYSQPSYSDSSLIGYIDNTKIVTNYGINIETNTPQPYVHDLTWNGISILNETDDDDGTVTTIGYAGISSTGAVTATSTYRDSDVQDGYFYTIVFNNNNINTPDLTNGNYTGLFLTPGWIKRYAAIPSDVTEVQAYDLSGDWENQNSGSNSRTVSPRNVKGHTFNNIEGIVLKFNNTSTIGSSSNNRTWKPTIPVAVRYVTTFGGGDLPIL